MSNFNDTDANSAIQIEEHRKKFDLAEKIYTLMKIMSQNFDPNNSSYKKEHLEELLAIPEADRAKELEKLELQLK